MRIVSVIGVGSLAAAAMCSGDISVGSDCQVEEHFTVTGTVNIVSPLQCPIYITSSGQLVKFGGAVRIQAISSVASLRIYNYFGELTVHSGFGFHQDWNDPNDGDDDESYGDFNLEYPAATGGKYTSNYDVGVVQFDAVNFGGQQANVFLTHTSESPIQIAGPGEILAWQDFTVSASLHDPSIVLPITKEWTLNGQVLPDTGWAIAGNSGESGTWFEYVLTVTGADGRTVSNFHRFYTKLCDFEGCNDQRRVGPPAAPGSLPVRARRGGS
jgi:hypothetical protein